VGMNTVTLDRRGRVTIPKGWRERLGLRADDDLVLEVVGSEVRLRPVVRKQHTVKARRRWGREAFFKSGEASFGGDE